MVRCVPTHTTLSTKGFAELFMREIFVHYGMPAGIVSDRGKQWRSSFFMEICRICGIFLALSTSHHPQTNGLVERYNEVIEAALRSYVSADHRDWHLFLPFIEFALNSTWNAALQSTPYRMNRISMPRNPLERKLESTGIKESVTHPQTSELTASVGSSKFKSSDRSMLQATVEFERARKCVHEAKIRMKERHDAKVRLDFEPLAQGDKVWLSQKYLSLKHPSRKNKLTPRWVGPFEILEVRTSNAVLLELPESMKVHPVFSTSLLKRYTSRDGTAPPSLQILGEEEWEVDSILDHHLVTPKSQRRPYVEFKAHWRGSYEDSWQPFDDFEHSMDTVNKYLMGLNPSVRKRVMRVLTSAQVTKCSQQLIDEVVA